MRNQAFWASIRPDKVLRGLLGQIFFPMYGKKNSRKTPLVSGWELTLNPTLRALLTGRDQKFYKSTAHTFGGLSRFFDHPIQKKKSGPFEPRVGSNHPQGASSSMIDTESDLFWTTFF